MFRGVQQKSSHYGESLKDFMRWHCKLTEEWQTFRIAWSFDIPAKFGDVTARFANGEVELAPFIAFPEEAFDDGQQP